MRRARVSLMFGAFAAFEFRYQLRSTMFVVTAAIFFAFSFALVAVPQLSRVFAGASHINSPHAISMIVSSMARLGMFIPVVFLSSVVMRDHALDTEGLFFTRPVTEFDYLAGRFVGAFAMCCLVLICRTLATPSVRTAAEAIAAKSPRAAGSKAHQGYRVEMNTRAGLG